MCIIFTKKRLCALRTYASLTPPIWPLKGKTKQNSPPAVISCRAGGWRPVFVEVECAKFSPKDARDHRRVYHCAASLGRKSLGEGGRSQWISLCKDSKRLKTLMTHMTLFPNSSCITLKSPLSKAPTAVITGILSFSPGLCSQNIWWLSVWPKTVLPSSSSFTPGWWQNTYGPADSVTSI